jgi:hypothetical protein
VAKRAPAMGGVSPHDVLASYDGLGFLGAIVDGILPQPPIDERLGFRLLASNTGQPTRRSARRLRGDITGFRSHLRLPRRSNSHSGPRSDGGRRSVRAVRSRYSPRTHPRNG